MKLWTSSQPLLSGSGCLGFPFLAGVWAVPSPQRQGSNKHSRVFSRGTEKHKGEAHGAAEQRWFPSGSENRHQSTLAARWWVDFPPTTIAAPQAGGQVWRKPYFPSPTRTLLSTGMPGIFFYEGGKQLLSP